MRSPGSDLAFPFFWVHVSLIDSILPFTLIPCVCPVIVPCVIGTFYIAYSSGQGLCSLFWHNFITLGTLAVL